MQLTNNFSVFEERVIGSLLNKKPDDYIAMILERPVIEVSEHIHSMTGSISPFREKLLAKEKLKQEKLIAEQKQRQRAKEIQRQRIQQEQSRKEFAGKRTAAAKAIQPRKPREKQWDTIVRDYSLLVTVRVDSRTFIYIKPGEDPEAAKRKYLDTMENQKRKIDETNKSYKPVKKFKPIQ